MLTIIIACIISIMSFIILKSIVTKEVQEIEDEFETFETIETIEEIKYAIPAVILLAGIFIGIFVPISGYEEPIKISTEVLVQYDNNEFIRYENSKIYYQIEQRPPIWNEDNPIPIVEKSVKKSSTEVSSGTTVAKIETYQKEGKQSIFTFALGTFKKEYKIYTP